MQYHPGPNMSKIRDSGGLPAVLWVAFIILAVGKIFKPVEYFALLLGIGILAIVFVPVVRRIQQRDSREEERLYGGHFLTETRQQSNHSGPLRPPTRHV